MYFSKYQKPFTLSFTRFTHFTLKIYAEFFTLFTRYYFTFYAFYQQPGLRCPAACPAVFRQTIEGAVLCGRIYTSASTSVRHEQWTQLEDFDWFQQVCFTSWYHMDFIMKQPCAV